MSWPGYIVLAIVLFIAMLLFFLFVSEWFNSI